MKKMFLLFCLLDALMQANAQNEPIYLFDEFVDGVVYLKNYQKSHVKINYDASNLKMVFINNAEVLQIDDNSLIDSVVVDKQLFIPFNGHFAERVEFEQGILLVEWKLVDKYTGKKIGAMGIGNSGSIEKINTGLLYARMQTDDNTQEIRKRTSDNTYYLNFDGRSVKFKNEKQLIKGFASLKEEIKDFIKSNNIDFTSSSDVKKLSKFILIITK